MADQFVTCGNGHTCPVGSVTCAACGAPITQAPPPRPPAAPPYPGTRWQYAVANIGTFATGERLIRVLGSLGAQGWELVNVYDKASNWIGGTEKGFMLFKRPVAPGQAPPEGLWSLEVDKSGALVDHSAQVW